LESIRTAAACAGLLALAGCITETTTTSRRGPFTTARSTSDRSPPLAPVAAPAREATIVNTAVRVAVEPLGAVPFDGQVLPIVSPDARFVATQVGDAPSWETLLALPEQKRPAASGVEIWSIEGRQARKHARVRPPDGPGSPVLLGRWAGPTHFVVELPRGDGTRALALARWSDGETEVIGDDFAVCTSLCFDARGSLRAWSRRTADASGFSLAIGIGTTGAGADIVEENASLLAPCLASGGSCVYYFAAGQDGLDVVAQRITLGESDLTPAPGPVLARRRLVDSADPVGAYQAVIGVQPPAGDAEEVAADPPGLLFFHPGAGRMAVFSAEDSSITLLAERSIAGCWRHDAAGGWIAFVTTPRGLVQQRVVRGEDGSLVASPAAPVLADAYVPRATADPHRHLIAIGPGSRDQPDRLTLVAVSVLPPAP